MIESVPHSDSEPTLRELLVSRARRASDGRLVADVIGGGLIATLVVIWRPGGWLPLLGAACCFLAFGAWGITDRVLREQVTPDRSTAMLAGLRIAAAVVGIAGAAMLLLGLWGLALGTWVT
jgi:hypothetical protein